MNEKTLTVKFLPLVILFVGIFAVSSASILIRYAQSDAPSLVIAAFRLSAAALVLAPVGILRHGKDIWQLPRKSKILISLSGIFLALHFASWITSLEYTSITSSVVLVTTTPLWVALLSPLVLKERITVGIWIGLMVAIAGSLIVALHENCVYQQGVMNCALFREFFQGDTMYGNLLALIGAWMAAGYMLVGRKLRTTLHATAYVFSVYSAAAIVLVLLVIINRLPVSGFPRETHIWMLLLALLPQLLGHSSFNWALGYLPAAFVSIALIGEPIGTIILAFLLMNEVPAAAELLGGLLILAGILIVSFANRKKKVENPA